MTGRFTAEPFELTVRIVPDEAFLNECYEEYVADVAWYRENGQLVADHSDDGYRTGVPPSWEEFYAEIREGWRAELATDHISFRVEARLGGNEASE